MKDFNKVSENVNSGATGWEDVMDYHPANFNDKLNDRLDDHRHNYTSYPYSGRGRHEKTSIKPNNLTSADDFNNMMKIADRLEDSYDKAWPNSYDTSRVFLEDIKLSNSQESYVNKMVSDAKSELIKDRQADGILNRAEGSISAMQESIKEVRDTAYNKFFDIAVNNPSDLQKRENGYIHPNFAYREESFMDKYEEVKNSQGESATPRMQAVYEYKKDKISGEIANNEIKSRINQFRDISDDGISKSEISRIVNGVIEK